MSTLLKVLTVAHPLHKILEGLCEFSRLRKSKYSASVNTNIPFL